MLCEARVRKAAKIVDMCRIDEGSGLENENSLLMSEPVGKIIGKNAAADARADDDDVEIVSRSDVAQEKTLLRRAGFRNEVRIGRGSEGHRPLVAMHDATACRTGKKQRRAFMTRS